MRRQWVWVVLAAMATAMVSCVSPQPEAKLVRYEFEQTQMNMPFRMVLYTTTKARAGAASRAAFRRIQEINDVLTDYDAGSELSQLSRSSGQGREVPVSRDLWAVLSRAQALAERTDGAFDVTVGPYVNLWRRARRMAQLPEPERLAKARESVGYTKVKLNPARQTVELLAPDMRLDLGGIAKGYAVDEAMKVLRSLGIRRALVAGSGDMAAGEPPPGKPGWRVELSRLDVTNSPPARSVLLKNAAIATSGDLFQRLEIDGKRYSHIVDPRTGVGLTDHSMVNVIARDCMTADSLTKVISVLGPEQGLRLLKETRGAEARVVRMPNGNVEARETKGFARYYTTFSS